MNFIEKFILSDVYIDEIVYCYVLKQLLAFLMESKIDWQIIVLWYRLSS